MVVNWWMFVVKSRKDKEVVFFNETLFNFEGGFSFQNFLGKNDLFGVFIENIKNGKDYKTKGI